MSPPPLAMRLDKWMWSARLLKTRAMAVEEIERGRVEVNGQAAKPARDIRPGDRIDWRQSGWTRSLVVRQLSLVRGPAPAAQALYEETPESLAARAAAAERRRLAAEPAQAIPQGRPTKRDRRDMDRLQSSPRDWNRWSASIDDE